MTMIKTVAGPFSKKEARDTASDLGRQYCAFGINVNDADGYIDDTETANNWYVEMDDSIPAERLFGYTFEEIMKKQSGE